MNTNCTTIVIGQRDGKYVHKCQLCRTEYLSKYAEPSMFKAMCRVKMRQAERPEAERPEVGPGAELTKIISELGLAQFGCGACRDLARKMNEWGVAGCRERRSEIVADIRQRADKVDWWSKSRAALALIHEPWWNPLDNIGSMVDEAIRRACLRRSE